MALVLQGGSVVSTEGIVRADVRIEGERIAAVGREIGRQGDERVDVSGGYLLPGGIDAHTHFDLPLDARTRTADSFATGTRAALAGGTTCVVDYATQFKGETLSQGLDNWHALADGRSFCDYAFHLAVTDWRPELVADLPDVVRSGVTSFKMYMAYRGSLQVDDGILYEMLSRLKALGGLLCVHCENGDVIAARADRLAAEGRLGPEWHPVARPEELETEAVERLLAVAALADAPAYVVHVSAAASMRRIVEAKMQGQRAYAETCPQYLYLDDSLYDKDGWEAAKYVCSPPLRGKRNQTGLWASLSGDLADVVATDHCSFDFAGLKERGAGDFRKIPNGMPGVESRMPLMYLAVAQGRISLPQMVRLTATNPARIFGMYPRKGAIVPGADADIVVFDPARTQVIRAETQYQNVDYTPFEGYEIPGAIASVYLRGTELYRDGRFLREDPHGCFVARGPSGAREG